MAAWRGLLGTGGRRDGRDGRRRRNGPGRGSAREEREGGEERAGTHDAETVDAPGVSGKQSAERDLAKRDPPVKRD